MILNHLRALQQSGAGEIEEVILLHGGRTNGLPEGFSLPADVVKFYERFGESILNEESETGAWARVVTPEEFNRIDAAIMGGERVASGPFENWFALVDVEDGNYIAIDLSVEHQGKCLDAFHETFAIPSYVDVVAASFTDLLNRFLDHKEDTAYWLDEAFESLGEAFGMYGIEPAEE